MKFYNPFKWHIWQSPKTGKWYVRRYDFLFGFAYVDCRLNIFWRNSLPGTIMKFCAHNNFESAKNTYDRYIKLESI